MAADDPLDPGVPRNGRNNPLIVPLKRGKPNLDGKLVEYTRASTFAKTLDDAGGLLTWNMRHAAVGVAVSPDLAAVIAAMGNNPDEYDNAAKAELDKLIATAHDRSGGNAKARYGTAVHSLTEDDGPERVAIDPAMQRDADAYRAAIDAHGLEPVTAEVFTVNDRLQVAGTYDHKYRLRVELTADVDGETVTLPAGTLLLGDKKTGRLNLLSHAVQLAVYARGSEYDHATGERLANDVNPQWGVVAHIPRGEGVCRLYLLDLRAGWKAAQIALQVREWRSSAGQRALAAEVADTYVTEPPACDAPVAEAVESAGEIVETAGRKAALLREPVGSFTHNEVAVRLGGVMEPVAHEPDDDEVSDDPTDYDEDLEPEQVKAAKRKRAAKLAAQAAPAVEVDEFGDPPAPTMADAVATLSRTLDAVPMPDPIMAAIEAAKDGDECRAIWSANRADWTDEHTAAVKAKLGQA